MSKHLAILNQPYLNLILNGTKTIESRFSRVRCAPYGVIEKGDIVLLKKNGGPVLGEFTVSKIETFSNLSISEMEGIEKKHGKEIATYIDNDFWGRRQGCKYATLMWVSNVIQYDKPYSYPKKDRRGWVVLKEENCSQPSLF